MPSTINIIHLYAPDLDVPESHTQISGLSSEGGGLVFQGPVNAGSGGPGGSGVVAGKGEKGGDVVIKAGLDTKEICASYTKLRPWLTLLLPLVESSEIFSPEWISRLRKLLQTVDAFCGISS